MRFKGIQFIGIKNPGWYWCLTPLTTRIGALLQKRNCKILGKLVLVTLVSVLLLNRGISQTIINPSNQPGYDSTKAASSSSTSSNIYFVTDSLDYQPGSTVIFSGGGFFANETVVLQVTLKGNPPGYGSAYNPFNVVCDNNGAFSAYWYVDSQNLGRQLEATVVGLTSGYTSKVLFTDGTALTSCYVAPDGTYTDFAANDDGSIGPISLGFNFNLYGTNYTQCYINNNGNITFSAAAGDFTSTGFPSTTPMIAPFWADVNSLVSGSATVKYKVSSGKIIVTWPGVAYYGSTATPVLLNTFQVILTDGTDASIGLGNNVAFYYGDMQWTTGTASGGTAGFGGTGATVGVNKGDGTSYTQVGRFSLNSSVYDGGAGADDGVNYLDYECFRFNVSNATNQAPSVSGVPTGNAITIPCGNTSTIALTFLPPEVNQTVSTSINTNSLCNTTVFTTSGTTSNANVTITAGSCNMGTNNITFTATDNFNPAGVTTVTIAVTVVANTTTASSNSPICAGSTLNLTCTTNAGSATYSWTGPNGFTSTLQNPTIPNTTTAASGTYTVTVTTSGCTSTATTTVTVNALPTITIGSISSVCRNASSISIPFSSTTNSPNQYNITWNAATLSAGVSNTGWINFTTSPITITNLPNTAGTFGGVIDVRNTTTGCVSAATTTICNTVNENSNLTLTAPSGTITSILFASYGTPTGSCGNFQVSACNATSSLSVLQNACVGNQTCTVAATNGVFTDPCVGTVKRLYVQASVTNNFSFVVKPTSTSTTNLSICSSALPYIWNGLTFNAAGTQTARLTNASGCDSAATLILTVNTLPTVAAIAGTPSSICSGSTVQLTDATSGGVWSSSNTTAIVSSSGLVTTGQSGGTATINYAVTNANGCTTTVTTSFTVTQNATIIGDGINANLCLGSTVSLGGGAGTWTSSNTAVATVSNVGLVTGIAAGGTTITQTTTSNCITTIMYYPYTVVALPTVAAITGTPSSICTGSTVQLTDATSGGVWSSNNTIAVVSSSGLVITGQSGGTATINYAVTNANGCVTTVTTSFTVTQSATIIGDGINANLCLGNTVSLGGGAGIWNSSNTSVATVSNVGLVTGIAAGGTTITQTTTSNCITTIMYYPYTVVALPTVPAITGSVLTAVGLTTTLSNTTSGGIWSSSATGIATINSSGIVTGVTTGSANISYTVTNSASCTTTKTATVTINPLANP